MPFRFDRRLTGLVLTFAVLAALSACGGKKRPPVLATTPGGEGSAASTGTTQRTPVQPLEEGPDVRAMQGEGAEGIDIAGGALGTGEGGPLADVHFDYDSAARCCVLYTTRPKPGFWTYDVGANQWSPLEAAGESPS